MMSRTSMGCWGAGHGGAGWWTGAGVGGPVGGLGCLGEQHVAVWPQLAGGGGDDVVDVERVSRRWWRRLVGELDRESPWFGSGYVSWTSFGEVG